MFKSAIIGAVALAAIALGGCQIGGTTITAPTAAQVIAAAQTACSYTPLATDVETVLNANKTIQNAQQIADLICSAVASATVTTAPGASLPSAVTIVVGGKTYVIHSA